jgi:hypothetical protein
MLVSVTIPSHTDPVNLTYTEAEELVQHMYERDYVVNGMRYPGALARSAPHIFTPIETRSRLGPAVHRLSSPELPGRKRGVREGHASRHLNAAAGASVAGPDSSFLEGQGDGAGRRRRLQQQHQGGHGGGGAGFHHSAISAAAQAHRGGDHEGGGISLQDLARSLGHGQEGGGEKVGGSADGRETEGGSRRDVSNVAYLFLQGIATRGYGAGSQGASVRTPSSHFFYIFCFLHKYLEFNGRTRRYIYM